ncbi:hypothetical protein L6452_31208 [Arctium lappa]|uniref:Uncharacterized protein n=1 Tax=Arctium lappa TaxID=4217 RepID=A0ACB8ZL81_ARCLA|nr:hypothetical protein L6452_31208 [Arctium lappa]
MKMGYGCSLHFSKQLLQFDVQPDQSQGGELLCHGWHKKRLEVCIALVEFLLMIRVNSMFQELTPRDQQNYQKKPRRLRVFVFA